MPADDRCETEVVSLFPRYLLKGRLKQQLLENLQALADRVVKNPYWTADASAKLAGQLFQQRELRSDLPEVIRLSRDVVLPACETWITHVMEKQPPNGRGAWIQGRYGLHMIDLWLNVQRAGDYNPMHTHGGSFSGVLFLQVPSQIRADSFDGQLCFHGPEEWHIQSFRTGMAHYVMPVPGDFYVFPAWQPHSVPPFRGDGERWSIAFNVTAVPSPPARPEPGRPPVANVSLSRSRPRSEGFL